MNQYIKKNLEAIIFCLVLTMVCFTVYFPLTKTFYQQDEWLGYGLYLAKGAGIILQSSGGIWRIILGQGRILTNLLLFIFYKFWPLNVVPIALFAILMQSINVLLVFFLSKRIFKKSIPAFLGSLFFAVNSVSQSAIIWPAASLNTLPSTTFILVSLVFFFKYLDNLNKKWLVLSFLLIYSSLFFKETGVFLFFLLPLFAFYYKKQGILSFVKTYWYFFIATFLIVVYRIWGFKSEFGQEALFITGSSKYFFDSIAIRAILYPLTSFSLSIVPPDIFLNFARYITNVYYPFIPEGQFILIAQTVVLDLLAISLSSAIGFLSLYLLKISEPKTRKNIVFWLIFILASFLPYIIISKSYSYLESRYYYLAAAAWAIIFAWLFHLLFERIKNIPIKIVAVALFAYFLFVHISTLYSDIRSLVNLSQSRIQIINQIKELDPTLTNSKNIFYITGDTDYLLPGNKVPFQQGVGFTLMTIYFKSGKIPKEFLNSNYLFEIGSQGYRESNGYGFGYFSDKSEVKGFLKRSDISITSLYYDSNKETIEVLDPSFLTH